MLCWPRLWAHGDMLCNMCGPSGPMGHGWDCWSGTDMCRYHGLASLHVWVNQGMLEEIVCEQVEDFINYRWDFKSYSTLEFVKLLRDPITALGYTYVLVLKSKGDNNDGASSSYVH